MEIQVNVASPRHPAAVQLLGEAESALIALYGTCSEIPRQLFEPPDGGYLIARRHAEPLAGGGFTRHDDTTAEIRRMYVVPAARSRGVARLLLAAIEDAVRGAGYERAILDTGPLQPHAERLYRSAGYTDIDNFRPESGRASYWGEKLLRSTV